MKKITKSFFFLYAYSLLSLFKVKKKLCYLAQLENNLNHISFIDIYFFTRAQACEQDLWQGVLGILSSRYINELITVETCERLWTRIHNMYRPDVDKYTMRMSAVEAQTLMDFVFPVMQASDEIFFDLIAGAFSNELHHQLDREIHVLNARYNYGQ